jgi:hypothetical protein
MDSIATLAAFLTLAGSLISPSVQADEAACKTLRDAMLAMTAVKYDAKILTTMPGRQAIVGEEIYTLDATYRQLLGRWLRTPTSPRKELDGEKGIIATFSDCHRQSSPMIGGEPVAIYRAKTTNLTLVPFSGDLTVWVSTKSGLPVRSEANASVPLLGASHTVKTYTYANVRAPS